MGLLTCRRARGLAGTRNILFSVMMLLTGCMVGPDFHPPSLALPDRYGTTATSTHTAGSAIASAQSQALLIGRQVSGRWWTLFRAPALTALVDRALRDSPNIEAAEAALRAAQEQNLAQTGTLLPSVTGLLNRTRGVTPMAWEGTPGPQPIYSAYTAQLSLNYTIDVWGGLRRAVEQTSAQADVQRFQLEAAYLSLSAGIAGDVILAASLHSQIAAQEGLIDFERRQLATVQQQFAAGGATGTDVATQKAQVAQAETVAGPLRTQLVQVQDQIPAYTGLAPSQMAIPVLDLSALTLPAELPVSIPADLLAQRPDVRAAEAGLHAQTAALGVAIAARLPNFTLQAGVGSTAADTHQLFSPTNGLWSVVNQVTQPIFDAGQLMHKQRAQQALMQQAAAQWRQTVATAFQNVADVLAAIRVDAETLQSALVEQDAAQQALSLASEQYRLGGVSYLSVLAAQQTYQNAVISLVRARAARFIDTVALFQSLGGGWWNR